MSDSTTIATDWNALADQVLSGKALRKEQALSVLDSSDVELPSLLAAAWKVRREHFGNLVQLYYLRNAKSGLCPEDCHYCSQSKVSDAEIPKYKLQTADSLIEGARQAKENGARTYCIVTSGRAPTDKEVDRISSTVRKIKDELGMHICCCLGLLSEEHAKTLSDAGVDRINHNLNTSERFHEEICSTHTFRDRVDSLMNARAAGLELCSGLIVGMGESHEDLVDVGYSLSELDVESIPVNFLNPIDGTPLEGKHDLDPRYCLKVLCLFRFLHPRTEIRVAGGREVNLRSLQPMSLYAANSMFVSDYLTTKGQEADADFQMIRDLGFEVELCGAESGC